MGTHLRMCLPDEIRVRPESAISLRALLTDGSWTTSLETVH